MKTICCEADSVKRAAVRCKIIKIIRCVSCLPFQSFLLSYNCDKMHCLLVHKPIHGFDALEPRPLQMTTLHQGRLNEPIGAVSKSIRFDISSRLTNRQCAAVHWVLRNEFHLRLSSYRSSGRNGVRGSTSKRDGLRTLLEGLDRRAGLHCSHDNLFGHRHHPDNSKSAGLESMIEISW